MGTALTGLEIRDTYDALIKVTDNGPLSGTLKALSDGLGNDSTLSLSTTAASIAGTLAVTGASTFNGLPTVNIAADNTTVGIFHTGGGTANKGLKISTFASVNDNAGVTLDAQTSTGVLAFATVSTERMRITSAGLVGIGTSSPSVKTEISGSASGDFAALALTNTNQAGTADAATLSFKLGRSVDAFLFTIPAVKFVKEQQWTSDGSTVDGALAFTTIANESTSERMRITSAGNVGIGTTSPVAKLQTTGANDASVITGLALENFIATNPASGNGVAVDFLINNSGNASAVAGKISVVNTFFRSNTDMAFSTFTSDTLTEKMRITSAGNVGIGTSSPNAPIQINGVPLESSPARATIRTFDTSSPAASVGAGLMLGYQYDTAQYVDGACVQAVKENATLGNYATALSFLNRANGVSFSEKMRITSAGVVELNQGQIKFPATQVPSADPNTLDDYEEGTFTPTFAPASGSYATLTYGTTNGKYTKIGNRVDFTLRVTITAYSAGTASGLLRLEGLPFACVASYVSSLSFSLVDDFAANRYPIKGFVNDTTSYILLRYMTALNTDEDYVSATDITATSSLRISGTYFTA